jgi:prepilin-type N-terminal cleavage/methylation domain-containing protein
MFGLFRRNNRKIAYRSGFSLVEMSMVITIVGVLAGAVVGGIKVVDNVQTKAAVGDMMEIVKAIQAFEDKYNALPGDIANMHSNFSAAPMNDTDINGNGNGILDGNEVYYFWYHLSIAGLYPINFAINADGTLTANQDNITASQTSVGTVPPGPKTLARYRVSNDTTRGLVIDYSAYSGNTATRSEHYPLFTPQELSEIDERMDDGDPATGVILAVENTNAVAAGSCFTGSAYNLTNTTVACSLRFVVERKSTRGTAGTAATCSGAPIGAKRQPSVAGNHCAEGFKGKTFETCLPNGTWSFTSGLREDQCEIVQCEGGVAYGQTRSVSCPSGYAGAITETCKETGLFAMTANTCTPVAQVGDACNESVILACPFYQTGDINMKCQGGKLQTAVNTCANKVACTEAVTKATTSCGTEFNGGAAGVSTVCTYDQADNYKPYRNICYPTYGACATVGTTRTRACPPGEAGVHTQQCMGDGTTNAWVDIAFCKPVTCNGFPVGSYRVADVKNQCSSGIGTAIEICDEDGQWNLDTTNCVGASNCVETYDLKGYREWPEAKPGEVVSTFCSDGYGQRSDKPVKRLCDKAGVWQTPYPECAVPLGINGLVLWLDANDIDDDGDTTNNPANAAEFDTWKDRSGNGNNVTQAGGARPSYTSSLMLGKPAVYFNGTADVLIADNVAPNFNNMNHTIIAVVMSTGFQLGTILGTYNSEVPVLKEGVTAGNNLWFYTPATGSVTYDTSNYSNVPVVLSFVVTKDNGISVYRTGRLVDKYTTPASLTLNQMSIGADSAFGGTSNYFSGYITELLIYNREISNAERYRLESYLNKKWGVAIQAPNSIAGVSAWYDADDPNADGTVLKGKTAVTNWQDKSGNNYDATTGATTEPLYMRESQNMLPVMRFDGADDRLTNASVPFAGMTYTTIVAVAKSGLANPGGKMLYALGNTETYDLFFGSYVGQNSWSSSDYTGRPLADATRFKVYTGQFTNNNVGAFRLWVNGFEPSPYTVISTPANRVLTDGMIIGNGVPWWGGHWWNGDIAEIVVYNKALSVDERRKVERVLAEKWAVAYDDPRRVPGIALWLDANDPDGDFDSNDNPANGAAVATWVDKSGNGMNAVAGTSPIFTTNAMNGLPVLNFAASKVLNNTTFALNTTVSTFAVVRPSTGSSYKRVINNEMNWYLGTGGALNKVAVFYGTGGTWNNAADKTDTDIGRMYSDKTYIMTAINDGTYDTSYLNGLNIGKRNDPMTAFNNGYTIGMLQGGASQYWNDYIAEIIVYNRALDFREQRFVEDYLAKKWGVLREQPGEALPSPTVWHDASDIEGTGIDAPVKTGNVPPFLKNKAPAATKAANTDVDCKFFNSNTVIMDNIQAGKPGLGCAGGTCFNSCVGTTPPQLLDIVSTNAGSIMGAYRNFRISDGSMDDVVEIVMGDSGDWFGYHMSNPTTLSFTFGNYWTTTLHHAITAATHMGSFVETGVAYSGTGSIYQNSLFKTSGAVQATVAATPAGTHWLMIPAHSYMFETIIFKRNLYLAERARVERYLMNKWDTPAVPRENIQAWYDAADIDGDWDTTDQPANGTAVATWYDKSGNGKNLTQGAGGVQPTYNITSPDGTPGLYFDGGDYMTNAALALAKPITVIAVADFNNACAGTYCFIYDSANCAARTLIHSGITTGGVTTNTIGTWETSSGYNGPASGATNFTNGNAIYTAQFNNGGKTIFSFDDPTTGTQYSSIASAAGNSTNLTIGAACDASWKMQGYINEFIMYDRSLTASERYAINQYLAKKWNIPQFRPDDIGGLQLWYDAADPGTIIENSATGKITQWRDKSGNGYHANVSSDGPIMVRESGLGNHDVLYFDDNDAMTISTLSLAAPYTVFVVSKSRTGAGGRVFGSLVANWLVGAHFTDHGYYGGTGWVSLYTNAAVPWGTDVAVNPGAGNATGYYDTSAASGSSSAAFLGAPGLMGLGKAAFGGGNACDDYIAEVIIYNSALSVGNVNNVRNYLRVKWGHY